MREKKVHDVYVRVSGQGQTLEQQEREIRAAMPAGLIIKLHQEKESAWDGGERPVFLRLVNKIAHGEVTDLWVWALDRLGRNVREILRFAMACKDKGCRLHLVKDNIDTDGPFAVVFISLLGTMAEMESSRRSERVKSKLDWLRSEFGYTMHGSPSGCVTKKVKTNLPFVLAALREGLSHRRIAAQFGMSPATVRKIAREPDKEYLTREEFVKRNPDWHNRPEDFGAPVHPRRRRS